MYIIRTHYFTTSQELLKNDQKLAKIGLKMLIFQSRIPINFKSRDWDLKWIPGSRDWFSGLQALIISMNFFMRKDDSGLDLDWAKKWPILSLSTHPLSFLKLRHYWISKYLSKHYITNCTFHNNFSSFRFAFHFED